MIDETSTNPADSVVDSGQTETRGQKLWNRLLDLRDKAPFSLERARLLTDSYKETEGLPVPIRRARAFEKIVTGIPIYIDDDQLLVGDYGSWPMATEFFPEFSVEWVHEAINRGENPFTVPVLDMTLLKEISEYWKDKGSRECFIRWMGEEEIKRLSEVGDEGAWVYGTLLELHAPKGWHIPDYPKAIRLGFSGLLAEIEEELRITPLVDESSLAKVQLLQALAIELKAGIRYGKRYAALARDIAGTAEGERKRELERIAEVCEHVPERPARNFYEALQTMHFCHLCIFWDVRTFGISPGRVDQFLYPYYKQDIEQGKLTRERAIELLECFRVKVTAERQVVSAHVRETASGETQFYNCTLGGQTVDGEDATNELSYLWLEAAVRTATPHPTLSIRWHDKLSPDFAMKAAELTGLGRGYPAWFGDKTSIPCLVEMGATLEEARDYAFAGCVLHVIPHKTGVAVPPVMNMPKVLELTLHNGVDPRLGKQFGPRTGNFGDLDTYEELYEAYKEQVTQLFKEVVDFVRKVRLWRAAVLPQIFSSCLSDDCIKRGQSIIGGGGRYQQPSMFLLPIGVADVVDSLAAIKKCVYQDGSVSKRELMHALEVNFEGMENIRERLLAAPKFGNDDDYVDRIATDIYSWLSKMLGEVDGLFGVKYVCAPHNMAFHGACGRRVGALPSGRLAGVAIAEGAVSPCQGADVNGPTAVLNSAGKIDHLPIYGALLNMKLHPSAMKTKEDRMKFLNLISTYFDDYGGKHIQFNVISRETLLDAQEHPEHHRNLVIRVAGYSALWVELDRVIQDEIIARTEHAF